MDFFFSLSSTVHSLFSCLLLRLVSEWWRLLFHVFCFTQKENWLAVSSRYNAAFQMGDLIYPQKLWVLFAKYAYRRFNSVHGVLCFPVVHCGIRQSDLLHVKSQAFEGFLGFCFENVTLNLCFHLKHSSFHVTAQTCLSTRRFLRKLIQDWPQSGECLDPSLLRAVPALFPSTLMHLHNIYFYGFFFIQVTVTVCCGFKLSARAEQQQSSLPTKQGQSRCWLAPRANRSIRRHEDKWTPICAISVMYLYL